MTREFIEKIIACRSIDTRNYRYIAIEEHDEKSQWLEIKRLPIKDLDTTAAIDGWQTVKRIY